MSARSEVEEIAMILVAMSLIVLSVAVIINYSGNFLINLRSSVDNIIENVRLIAGVYEQ